MKIKSNKKQVKKKEKGYILIILAAIVFVLDYFLFGNNTVNFPNYIMLIPVFATLIVCIYSWKKKQGTNQNKKNRWSFLIYFFSYSILSVSIFVILFDFSNYSIIKSNESCTGEYKIKEIFLRTSRSPCIFVIDFNGSDTDVSVAASEITYELSNNKSLMNKSYLCLEYKKGILGTYIIISKDIISK